MNRSGVHHRLQGAVLRHPGLRWLALAAGSCSLILAAGCAGRAPQHPAAASPKPSAAAPAARPSSPVSAVPSPVAAVPSSAPPAASTVPLCEEPNLAASASRYNIGGGMWGVVITLTNTGTASCSMYGYPGLGLQDYAHHVLPSQTHWGPTYFAHNPGPSLIVLAPGQSASSSVALSQGTQRSPWAGYLEITPPGNYQYALIDTSYGIGDTSGDLYATAMARQTVIYRGGPGGCGCSGAP
jgi:Protein of unknown function (DUF4232)